MRSTTILLLLFSISVSGLAQTPASERQQFIRAEAPVIALTHVRVIDGTGAAPLDDQTIVISNSKIQSIAPSNTAIVPQAAEVLDLKGYTVLPGLVGMHNHLFFPMGGPKAIALLNAALRDTPETGADAERGAIYVALARVYRSINEPPIARDHSQKALEYYRRTGEWRGLAEVYSGLAVLDARACSTRTASPLLTARCSLTASFSATGLFWETASYSRMA